MVFGAFEAELRKFVPEGFVGFVKRLLGDGIASGEVLAHADGLGALAGKEERDSLR